MLPILENPLLKIIQTLAKSRNLEVYLVGGFLRDHLLGISKNDFDFAVSKDAIGLARKFASKIKGAFVLLDEEHGCARVVKKTEGRLTTFDFADFRDKTFLKDLSHRDFTINTLSVDIKKINEKTVWKELIVDNKKGLKDLKAKTIRMTSLKVFKEDPLRLLRAFSMKAVLNFKIEAKTILQIKKDRDLIRKVSAERIREELFKILESPRAYETFKAMDKMGLLERVIPQIAIMYRCTQGGYHHLDVWPHSLEAVNQLEKLFVEVKDDQDIVNYLNETLAGGHSRKSGIKLATLLHDIGKPDTRKIEKGKFSFHGHERVGRDITRHITKQLKMSTHERHAVEDMVLWHLRPGYLGDFEHPTEKAVYRYFRDTKDEAASILLLSIADQRATRGPLTTERDQLHHAKICFQLIQRYFEQKKQKPFVPFLNGHDLLKLGLKPSPEFGKLLTQAAEAQVLGKVTNKEDALALVKLKIKNLGS